MIRPSRGCSLCSLRLALVPLCLLGSLPTAQAGSRGMLCSDLTIPPPTELHKVKNKVIYQEVVDGVFPGALFPLSYAETHEVASDDLYYDDQGRVLSGRAAVAILQNHPASQDAIGAWRGDREAESQARMSVAVGVVGAATSSPATAASSVGRASSALDDLDSLDGGAETAFYEAVCAFNAAMANRRARSRP